MNRAVRNDYITGSAFGHVIKPFTPNGIRCLFRAPGNDREHTQTILQYSGLARGKGVYEASRSEIIVIAIDPGTKICYVDWSGSTYYLS